MKKIIQIIVIIVSVFIVFELFIIIKNRGNVNIDFLCIAGNFDSILVDSIGTVYPFVTIDNIDTSIALYRIDSVDYSIYIDNYLIEQGVILKSHHCTYRNTFFLKPQTHILTIKSTKLKVNYNYSFTTILFNTIWIECDDKEPCFWISKHYVPLKRWLM